MPLQDPTVRSDLPVAKVWRKRRYEELATASQHISVRQQCWCVDDVMKNAYKKRGSCEAGDSQGNENEAQQRFDGVKEMVNRKDDCAVVAWLVTLQDAVFQQLL